MTAAQTPMVLVGAGGTATWSAECEKALVQCGYDPEAFGTYKHVKGKIDEAGAKVAKWEGTPPASRDPAGEPSAAGSVAVKR